MSEIYSRSLKNQQEIRGKKINVCTCLGDLTDTGVEKDFGVSNQYIRMKFVCVYQNITNKNKTCKVQYIQMLSNLFINVFSYNSILVLSSD